MVELGHLLVFLREGPFCPKGLALCSRYSIKKAFEVKATKVIGRMHFWPCGSTKKPADFTALISQDSSLSKAELGR